MKSRGPRINEQIRVPEVRLIGADGSQVGVVSIEIARAKAEEAGLDLVEINGAGNPPVVKVIDWGKFRYEETKKKHEQRIKNKPKEEKTVRISIKIGAHDFENKVNQAKKFLAKGHRVKVSLFFKGREIAYKNLGIEKINLFLDTLKDLCDVEDRGEQGREVFAVLTAKKI